MNNIINKIKLFLKGKPARIIIALLVIAAIMTGVAFGVIALVNAFSDPCTNQPGTTWDKNLKFCVKNSCEINGEDGFVCKNKKTAGINKCIPKNYCDYSTEEGQYYYNHETCECKLDCSSLSESNAEDFEGFTKDGNNSTKMKPDPNNPDSFIPEDNLHCGKSCSFNKTNNTGIGGNRWCPPSYLCGEWILSNGINLSPNSGCFPDNGTYEQCSNSENICLTNTCEIPSSGPRAGKESCKIITCDRYNEEGNKLIYPCINDEDCVIPGTSMDEAVCLKGESAIEDEKFKYYKQVGYCKNTNQLRDLKCTTADMLGEKNKDGYYQPTNCSNFNCDDCTDIKGVAGKNNPCDDNMINNTFNSCAKFGICTNNHWQAKNQSSDVECLSGSPPEDIEDNLTICCPKNQIADMPNSNNKFCCPIDSVLAPDGTTKLCSLNTEFGYSKRILTNDSNVKDLKTTIPCKSDSQCEIYNNDLWKNLGKTGDNPLDITSYEFSTMYCDTNKGVCKAMCGLFNKSGNEPLNNEFGVLNNSYSEHSYCFSKNQECKIGPITYGANFKGKKIGHSSINGIPVCSAPGSSKSPRWTSNKDSGFLTAGKTQLFNPDGKTACSKSVSEQTCLNALGKNMYQVNDIEVQPNGCTFEVACNQLPVTFQHKDGELDSIMWNELLTSPKFTNDNFKFEQNISQSPVYSLSEPNTPKLYYDNTNNCKGNTNNLDPKLTKSPLKYIPSTRACTPTTDKPLILTNEGKVCYTGINPITNDCLTSNEKIENFSSVNNQDLIYGAVSYENPTTANITDGTYNYYCGDLGLKTEVIDPTKNIKRDDGATINLKCNDNIKTGRTATISCYDKQAETNCCQKQPYQTGKILKKGNTFECSSFEHNPDEQFGDYYLCTNKDNDKVGNSKRVKKLLYKDVNSDPHIINNATKFPQICDLRNEYVKMYGCTSTYGRGCRDETKPVCNLIKLGSRGEPEAETGCADLDHNLKGTIGGTFKDGLGNCKLQNITLPPGINVDIFNLPSCDKWCDEEFMCQFDRQKCYVQGGPKFCVPTRVLKNVNTISTADTQTVSGLEKKTCSMSFKLDPKINPHACG